MSVLIIYSILQLRERVRRSAQLEADRLAFRRRVLQEDETAEWFCTMYVSFSMEENGWVFSLFNSGRGGRNSSASLYILIQSHSMHRLWQFHEPILAQKMKAAMAEQLEKVRPSRVQVNDRSRLPGLS